MPHPAICHGGINKLVMQKRASRSHAETDTHAYILKKNDFVFNSNYRAGQQADWQTQANRWFPQSQTSRRRICNAKTLNSTSSGSVFNSKSNTKEAWNHSIILHSVCSDEAPLGCEFCRSLRNLMFIHGMQTRLQQTKRELCSCCCCRCCHSHTSAMCSTRQNSSNWDVTSMHACVFAYLYIGARRWVQQMDDLQACICIYIRTHILLPYVKQLQNLTERPLHKIQHMIVLAPPYIFCSSRIGAGGQADVSGYFNYEPARSYYWGSLCLPTSLCACALALVRVRARSLFLSYTLRFRTFFSFRLSLLKSEHVIFIQIHTFHSCTSISSPS